MPSQLPNVPPKDFNLDFTIEEIRGQLNALGITDLSETQLAQLKNQLDAVIQRERANLSVVSRSHQTINGDDPVSSSSPPLTEGSSTPRTVSPAVTQDDLMDVNQMCGNVSLNGVYSDSTDSGTHNSNSAKQVVSGGSNLLTVPPRFITRRLHRHTDHSLRAEDSSCLSSGRPIEEPAQYHSPSEVLNHSIVRATPRIELSIQTPSEATEPCTQDLRQNRTSSLLPTVVPPTPKNNPLTALEPRLIHGITDLGDFISSQPDTTHFEKLESKPTVPTSHRVPRIVHYRPPASKKISSTSSSQLTVTSTQASSSWDSTNSVSQRSNAPSFSRDSDGTAGLRQSQHLRSASSQPSNLSVTRNRTISGLAPRVATHGPVSGQTRHLRVTMPDNRSYTISSSTVDTHGQLSLPVTTLDVEPEVQIPPQSSGIKSHIDRNEFEQDSRQIRTTNPGPGTIDRSVPLDRHSELNSSTHDRHRFITPNGLHTRGDWSRRGVLKASSCATSLTVSNTARTRNDSKTESTLDCSGSRSARFPENPVSKVHNLQVRPHTASSAVSQTARSSTSSQSHRTSCSSVSLPRRQDPVARYHSYQRSWLTHTIPGEDARRVLRWNVKTAMMHREVPVLQRNLAEVTQLFGSSAAAMLARQRQRKLKELNLDHVQSANRHHVHPRCRFRAVLNQCSDANGSGPALLSRN